MLNFKATLQTKRLKEPKGRSVTGQKWMFYMSALFCIGLVLAFFVSSSSKIHSFGPDELFDSFTTLTVVRAQLKMVDNNKKKKYICMYYLISLSV